jgi:hypothetical protein
LLHKSEKWEGHEGINLQEDKSDWAQKPSPHSHHLQEEQPIGTTPRLARLRPANALRHATARCASAGQHQRRKASDSCLFIYLEINHNKCHN